MIRSATTSVRCAEADVLIRQVASGDALAFETLCQRYTPRLMRYLQPRLGDVVLAEDVCQEVLLIVWTQAGAFQALASLSTWIFGIAQRQAWKAYARWSQPVDESTSMTEAAPEGENPEIRLCRQSQLRWVAQAVGDLPPVLRRTIILYYYHDYTYREIAVQMECAETTVKNRLRQAKQRLAALLRRRELVVAEYSQAGSSTFNRGEVGLRNPWRARHTPVIS